MEKQKLLQLASKILYAGALNDDEEILQISEQFADMVRQRHSENGETVTAAPQIKKDLTGFLKFTDKRQRMDFEEVRKDYQDK